MMGADGKQYNSMEFLLRNDFLTSGPVNGMLTVQCKASRIKFRFAGTAWI